MGSSTGIALGPLSSLTRFGLDPRAGSYEQRQALVDNKKREPN